MTSSPRLVASDLDGTLVRSDGTVSERARAAIAAVEAAGVPFVMVTGRPPRWMAQVAEDTGHRGVAICANGAILYDLHTEQVLQASLIGAAEAGEVVTALRAALPDVTFAVEDGQAGFGHEPGYRPRWESGEMRTAPIEELYEQGVAKLLVRHEGMDGAALHAAALAVLGALVETSYSSPDGLLEITASGVTKATGLAVLAAQHGVDAADVIAFGDMPNDLPMLLWSGRGVAMANAHPDVKAVADEMTSSNDDDGVAAVLERWF
ncbi:MAG: Cof-type HAD-IIB family hydrolase [Actinomycetota bacterium]|nr:Cof-type HAD-IIB family hydrolase [Actinomycetota bacterium]